MKLIRLVDVPASLVRTRGHGLHRRVQAVELLDVHQISTAIDKRMIVDLVDVAVPRESVLDAARVFLLFQIVLLAMLQRINIQVLTFL